MKTTSFSSTKLLALAAVLVLFSSFFALSHVYASLIIAFVLAYLLDPLVERLDEMGFSRSYSAPACLFFFMLALVLLGMAVIPKIMEQGRELVFRLPQIFASLTASLAPISLHYFGYDVFQDLDKALPSVGDASALVAPLGGFAAGLFTHTFRFVTAALGLLVIPLMAYYLLRDFPMLFQKFLYVVPKRHHKAMIEIRERLHGVLGGFIRGQLVVSAILSSYYVVAFSILRIELALVLGLMAGFFNIVPYVGIVSAMLLAFLIAVLHGASAGKLLALGCVFAFGMAVEGSALTPRIVGRKVGLSPLTLILALLVGGELLGLAGMLLAVPIAAIGKVFLSVLLERYRASVEFKRL